VTAIVDSFFFFLPPVDSLVTRRSSHRVTSALGISAAQAGIIYVLATSRRSTVAELADTTGITSSAISRLVGRVEGQGLLVRSRRSEDHRIRKLTLTPQGYKLAIALAEIRCSVASELFSGLTAEELGFLAVFVRRIHSSVHGQTSVSSGLRPTPGTRKGVSAASSIRCRRTVCA